MKLAILVVVSLVAQVALGWPAAPDWLSLILLPTVFIIAHRVSTLREADRILVLEEGQITMEGRHEDLVSTDGLYKRIWDIQNAGSEQ